MTTGPLLGSILFQYGFQVPFFFTGAMLLALMIPIAYCLKDDGPAKVKKIDSKDNN